MNPSTRLSRLPLTTLANASACSPTRGERELGCAAQACFIASPPMARGHVKEQGLRSAERPRPYFMGSLSAPRCGDILSPFPSLTASSAGSVKLPAEMEPDFPTRAGGRRAPEVVRYTGRETRDHSFSDEVAPPFRGSPQAPRPSPRDHRRSAARVLLDEGWAEFSAGCRGGDKLGTVHTSPQGEG